MATESEQFLQRLLRRIARMIFRKGEGGPIEAKSLRRVLVIRSDDRVGNVLLTTPLLRALREGLPHARIDWLIAASRRPLVEGLFLADRLVPFDRNTFRRRFWRLLRLLNWLREAGYDAVIDAAHHDAFSLSSALLVRWTKAPIRIGHDRGDAAHFYSHLVSTETPGNDVSMKLALLGPLGLPPRGNELETALGRSPEVEHEAENVLARSGIGGGAFIVVNPGARKRDRRYDSDALGRLVSAVTAQSGMRALVIWGPGEEELARATVAAAGSAAVLAPDTSLDLLAALLRKASLLITNDTGPMHLGVACGVPVLALFTVDSAERWGHELPTFRAVAAWPGAPDPIAAAQQAAEALLGTNRADASAPVEYEGTWQSRA